ncbi:MAG: hypothetical protein E6J87_04400 [Deltaproteobacteria bacterium]|nr:MAG: hypothetical protein E6J87_04400 [Deltaproteobacteria bacterium]
MGFTDAGPQLLQHTPCGARTRMGRPCRAPCVPGRKRCKLHGGRSTGPRTAEGLARLAEASQTRARTQRRDAAGRFADL